MDLNEGDIRDLLGTRGETIRAPLPGPLESARVLMHLREALAVLAEDSGSGGYRAVSASWMQEGRMVTLSVASTPDEPGEPEGR